MEKIICAFSGGPDSVFLALYLRKNFPEKDLILAHFNHHLRGDESFADEDFCRNFAIKNKYSFEKGDWEDPKPSEEKARNARYGYLESVRKKYDAQWVCTGHHKDDVSETVLLQFLRGGGLPALSGIAEKNPQKKLWRPLLGISKKEILSFLETKNISYRTDSSNNEDIYTRNFLRNEIFPKLAERFPKFSDRIAKKTLYFSDIQLLLEEKSVEFIKKNDEKQGIEKKIFFAEKFPVRCEIMKSILPDISWSMDKFQVLESFLKEGKSGKKFQMKRGEVQIFGEKFFIEKK